MGKNTIRTLKIILFVFCFRVLFALHLGLVNDEAYYWVWAQHLSLSYFDHPPLVAYFIAATTAIFGNTAFGIRMASIIVSALASIGVFMTARILFDSRVGMWAVALLNVFFVAIIGGFIVAPDTPLILFWAAAMSAGAMLVKTQSTKWWYLIGLLVGLGLLGKYMMILFIPAMVLFCFSQSEFRKWFLKPAPYFALLLIILVFLPVLIWNYNHDWISFAHQFSHGLAEKESFTFRYFFEYIAGQMMMTNPIFFVIILFMIWQGIIRKKNDAISYLSWLTIIPLAFFGVSSLRAKVEANWPVAAYLSGAVLLAYWFDKRIYKNATSSKPYIRLLYGVIIFNIIFSSLVLVHVKLDLFTLKHDRTDEIFGWEQLAKEVQFYYKKQPFNQKTFIIGDSYQLASQLYFNLHGKQRVYENPTEGRANVFSVIDDFSDKKGWNVIFVCKTKSKPNLYLKKSFKTFNFIKTVKTFRKNKQIGSFDIYFGENLLKPWKIDLRKIEKKLLDPKYF